MFTSRQMSLISSAIHISFIFFIAFRTSVYVSNASEEQSMASSRINGLNDPSLEF